jgi:hypothetical protein
MELFTKEDLAQMERPYLESLERDVLVDVAVRLRQTSISLIERLEKDSSNSSKPPSSDSPYKRRKEKEDQEQAPPEENPSPQPEEQTESQPQSGPEEPKRPAGRQRGSQGFGRTQTLSPTTTVPHYPETCAVCGKPICVPESAKPYMGFYVLELENSDSGIQVVCSLHHYYAGKCSCGHETKAQPGVGVSSRLEGRKKDLTVTEYTIVGPRLATFITALSVRYRMSRAKIKEFLQDWLHIELSVGTIDKSIREAGVACFPIVETLVEELQEAEVLHLDETPWHEKGSLRWLWVAICTVTAVYYVGSRKKEELLNLVSTAFIGWLVTDGYGAYRDREKRQRCLAHLIRKAVALSGAVDQKAHRMGDWLLKELRGLIKAMAEEGENDKTNCSPILARLKRACNLGSKADHPKLRSLAREILNDWDAVVAFVKNPGLPPTNNEAERALRHAVISRRISQGTRTPEGSRAFAALLSVIETCRLRGEDPWDYLTQTIALARKGATLPTIPQPAKK